MTNSRRIIGAFIAASSLALCSCVGSRVTIGASLAADPAVKWVFRTGHEVSLGFWMYPMLKSERVSSGALVDSRVILLCNLDVPPEELMAGRVYVLDANDGSVLKVIQGPARAETPFSVDVAPITDRYAYFAHPRQEEWPAIDFNAGRVCWHPPPPAAATLAAARRPPWSYNKVQSSHDPWERTYEEVYDLASGRQVTISGRAFMPLEFRLRRVEPGGSQEDRLLCRLPYRHTGGMHFLLLADDDRYFILAWGCYVICVNAKDLDALFRE